MFHDTPVQLVSQLFLLILAGLAMSPKALSMLCLVGSAAGQQQQSNKTLTPTAGSHHAFILPT
jgi:hypothetical protein